MICHDAGCIFVHIPKTAGTSLEIFFTGYDWIARNARDYVTYQRERDSYTDSWGGTLCAGNPDYFNERLRVKHATQAELRSGEAAELWDAYFCFTFVRNPWDRVLSVFDHGRRDAPQRMPEFREWLLQDEPLDHMGQPVFREWIHDWDDLDFVGRFEHLDADFPRLLRAMGYQGNDERLPVVRLGGDGQHRLELYDDETRERVATRCAAEIERFGYGFGSEASKPAA